MNSTVYSFFVLNHSAQKFSSQLPTRFGFIVDDLAMDDSSTSFRWGDIDFHDPLPVEFSDVPTDDFLVADGLMDDFSELIEADEQSVLSLSAADVICEENMKCLSAIQLECKESFESLQTSDRNIQHDEPMTKIVRDDRSRPPSPKRPRKARSISPSPVKSIPSPPIQSSLEDLQLQYKIVIEKLAVSMRRSEMTRSEIVSFRQAAETRAKLEAAEELQLRNANYFLTGSRSTLTVGLEQSRQMLRNYMNFMPSGPL